MAGQNTVQKSQGREHEESSKGSVVDTEAWLRQNAFGR